MNKVLVCGAGGFIGGHLVADLRRQGVKSIRAVDIKPLDQWYQRFDDVEDFGIQARVARYHNVYGPNGTYDGGREKAPAAMCRKIITTKLSGKHELEIWGDGHQTRSFMYIDDCLHGTQMLTRSDYIEPINIGSSGKGEHQPARRCPGGNRGHQTPAPLQARCAERRERTPLRQHAHPVGVWLGAEHAAARRHGENLPLDPRSNRRRPRQRQGQHRERRLERRRFFQPA